MNITLDGLKEGKYRKLTDRELNELDQLLEQSSSLPGGRKAGRREKMEQEKNKMEQGKSKQQRMRNW